MLFIFKLLFAYIGYQAANWLGVVDLAGIAVGLFVGHIVDYAATIRFARWRATRAYAARARKEFDETFLSSLFLMFGHICASDGVIQREEISSMERVMNEMLQLNRRSRAKAIAAFKNARSSNVPFQVNAMKYFELYQNHPEILESTLQLFLNVAAADSPLNEAEQRLIKTAAMIFGVDERRLMQLQAPYMSSGSSSRSWTEQHNERENDAYSVLGCDRRSSIDDIKKSYRKLAMEYHPDTIVSKGLPEEFIKFANRKFASIQSAYEEIKAERGF